MCRTVVNIPITHIGRVIGKGGQTIKHLQDLSGAHIDLPKVNKNSMKKKRFVFFFF